MFEAYYHEVSSERDVLSNFLPPSNFKMAVQQNSLAPVWNDFVLGS